jgi:hypothetical protein
MAVGNGPPSKYLVESPGKGDDRLRGLAVPRVAHKLKVSGKPLSLQTGIYEDGEWMRGLSWRIKNNSIDEKNRAYAGLPVSC